MDIFTLALYVVLIGYVGYMVYKLVQAIRNDRADKNYYRRLEKGTPSRFEPKHGKWPGRRK